MSVIAALGERIRSGFLRQFLGRETWALTDQAVVSATNFLTNVMLLRFMGLREFGVFILAWMSVQFVNSLQTALIIAPMMSISLPLPCDSSASLAPSDPNTGLSYSTFSAAGAGLTTGAALGSSAGGADFTTGAAGFTASLATGFGSGAAGRTGGATLTSGAGGCGLVSGAFRSVRSTGGATGFTSVGGGAVAPASRRSPIGTTCGRTAGLAGGGAGSAFACGGAGAGAASGGVHNDGVNCDDRNGNSR